MGLQGRSREAAEKGHHISRPYTASEGVYSFNQAQPSDNPATSVSGTHFQALLSVSVAVNFDLYSIGTDN